jgi:uncharacterized protein YkwD
MLTRAKRAFGLAIIVVLALIVGQVGAQAIAGKNRQTHLVGSASTNQVDEEATMPLSAIVATPGISETILMPVLLVQPTPTVVPSPTPTLPNQPPWLIYLNRFRTNTGLESLDEIDEWSHGGWLHSRYMVKNDDVGHSEDPGNPWYSPEGHAAAQSGNVFVASWDNAPDETPIDFWMTAPFHAISMLDPQLHSTGFGIYREALGLWKTGATLDVGRGIGSMPTGTTFPIPYPADGGSTFLTTYSGYEFPDPLTSCPGYNPPTGSPIMLQLGSGNMTPQVTGHQLWANGIPVESCLFDETSYVNPDPVMQSTGRIVLNIRDAIVIMPRNPLEAGSTYTVEVTTTNATTNWSFTVDGSADDPQSAWSSPYQIGSYTNFNIK